MATKQLEILVKARDEASGVFAQVGNSAGGMNERMGGLVEQGEKFHRTFRRMEGVIAAVETAKVGIAALSAAFTTLTGTQDEAAEAQRGLFKSIGEIPVVGKPAAAAAEFLGSALAHALGKESTADIEAEMKKKEEAIKAFAESVKKTAGELKKEDSEAAMIGLTPSDAAIAKAKDKYADAMAKVHEARAKAIAAAGADESGTETQTSHSVGVKFIPIGLAGLIPVVKENLTHLHSVVGRQYLDALKQADQLAAAADKIRDAEIAKAKAEGDRAHAQELEAEREFTQSMAAAQQSRAEQLAGIQESTNQKQLEAEGRGYEARLAGLDDSNRREIEKAHEAAAKRRQELDKMSAGLAGQSGPEADKKRAAIEADATANNQAEMDQVAALQKRGAGDTAAARQDEIHKAQLAALQLQADAGNQAARAQLEQVGNSEKQLEMEKALAAIAGDAAATERQRADAARALNDVKAGAAAKDGAEAQKRQSEQEMAAAQRQNDLQSVGIDLLRQEAELGDKSAAAQLRQLEVQQKYTDEKKRLLELAKSASTEEEKAQARALLAGVDDAAAKAAKAAAAGGKTPGRENSAGLATAEIGQFLTGVAARAQQEKSDPAVEAAKEQTGVLKQMLGAITQLVSAAAARAAVPAKYVT